jgi:PAS domain-containing protein
MGVVPAPESLPLAVAAIRSSISAGVVVEDRDGNVAIANAAAQRLLGPYVATSPGWRAAPGWELTDADGGALTHEALAPSLARARKVAVREQLIGVRAPSGAQAWLTLDAEPVLNEHGQLEGVVITITDRTGVMQIVRELSANHAELRHVVDAGHDGYFIRDFTTGATVHSARMNALVGLPAVDTEVGLDDWRQRIHPDDSDRLARAYQAVTSGAVERFDLTYRVRCEDGAWRWVRSRGKVVAQSWNRFSAVVSRSCRACRRAARRTDRWWSCAGARRAPGRSSTGAWSPARAPS